MKSKKQIRWISGNTPGDRENCGYWKSAEGRFHISPNYRGTVYPSHYTITDYMGQQDASRHLLVHVSFDRVRDAKEWAEGRVPAAKEGEA
jgi:hypothetical protein